MELKIIQSLLIFSLFFLVFFLNYAESICVPRNASRLANSPNQAPKVQTESSSPRTQPVPGSPPPKSASSPPPESASSPPLKSASAPPPKSASAPPPKSSSAPPLKSSSPSSSSSSPPLPASVPPLDSPDGDSPSSDSPDGMTLFDTGLTGKGSGFLAKTIKPFLDHQMHQIDGALNHICKQTDYSDLCLSSLAPLFNGDSDPISMLYVAIKACTQHAQLSLDTAQKIAKAPFTNPITASKLSDCQDSYSDALDNLQAANDAVGVRDFGKVNSMLSAVVTDASDCQDQFPGKSSPMLDFEVKLRQMASNCLAIVSLAM